MLFFSVISVPDQVADRLEPSDDSSGPSYVDYSERRSLPISIPDYHSVNQNGEKFVVCVCTSSLDILKSKFVICISVCIVSSRYLRVEICSKSTDISKRIFWSQKPGRVAQSVGHPTRKSGVLGLIPGLATYFRFSFRFFKKGSCQLLAKVCARSTG